jgi:protein-tyrosine phosphatase
LGEIKVKAEVFWINEKFPGRLALVPRPRGGDWLEDEALAWKNAGLDAIVSMLESEEVESFELEREAEFCQLNGIEFISFPVTDRSVPVLNESFFRLLEKLKTMLLQGKSIGIHCRQSIGRAPLLAAFLMISFGIEPNEAFHQLSLARGREVPETNEQKRLAETFYKELSTVLA